MDEEVLKKYYVEVEWRTSNSLKDLIKKTDNEALKPSSRDGHSIKIPNGSSGGVGFSLRSAAKLFSIVAPIVGAIELARKTLVKSLFELPSRIVKETTLAGLGGFDPTTFPNLSKTLKSQGINPSGFINLSNLIAQKDTLQGRYQLNEKITKLNSIGPQGFYAGNVLSSLVQKGNVGEDLSERMIKLFKSLDLGTALAAGKILGFSGGSVYASRQFDTKKIGETKQLTNFFGIKTGQELNESLTNAGIAIDRAAASLMTFFGPGFVTMLDGFSYAVNKFSDGVNFMIDSIRKADEKFTAFINSLLNKPGEYIDQALNWGASWFSENDTEQSNNINSLSNARGGSTSSKISGSTQSGTMMGVGDGILNNNLYYM